MKKDRSFIRKTIGALLLMVILPGIVPAQKRNQADPWFFIQLTDPQFGMFDGNKSYEKETALYEKAVAKINQLHPDFVVITGDFVHDQHSVAQINEFKRITANINKKIPVYYSPGNHDIGQNPDETSLENYRRNFGSDIFSFRHKGSMFIGFNTGIIKAKSEKLEKKQLDWLTNLLRHSQKAQHVILFTHYPFFNKTFDEPTAYSNIDKENRLKYLDLFSANNVDAIFCGHHHNNGYATYGKMELVTTSALGKPLGNAPSGFRIIKVYHDKIEHEFFGLEEVPGSVKFD
jgi:3',5'-cyclic AMP phosphodiesterase CpdA